MYATLHIKQHNFNWQSTAFDPYKKVFFNQFGQMESPKLSRFLCFFWEIFGGQTYLGKSIVIAHVWKYDIFAWILRQQKTQFLTSKMSLYWYLSSTYRTPSTLPVKRNLLTYLDGALVFSLYIGVVAQVDQKQGFWSMMMNLIKFWIK